MSQELTVWVEKLKKEVTEGTPMARRIRLMTAGEGTIWATWEPVSELVPAEWAAEAEALLTSLKFELPKKRVQVVFVAEDHGGASISNKPRTITGENANAQDLGTQNGAKALADAMTQVGKLMETTLEQARKMLDWQATRLDAVSKELSESHEVIMAIKKAEIETDEHENATSRVLVEQVQQASPLLLQAFQHWITTQANKGPGGVAAAAAATTNGAH